MHPDPPEFSPPAAAPVPEPLAPGPGDAAPGTGSDAPARADVAAPRRPFRRVSFWLLLTLYVAVMFTGSGEMWLFGHHGWCGARRSIAGVNFVRHGYIDTKFGAVDNYGAEKPKKYKYYWHHPMLMNVLVGASFHAFGIHERASRFVPIAFSVICFVLLWTLLMRWWREEGAIIGALLLTFLPMSFYHGKLVDPQSEVVAFGIALFWVQVRFRETRAWRYVFAAAAVALVGSFTDWPFFLVAATVGGFEFVRQLASWRRDRDLRFFIVLTAATALGAFLVFWHLLSLQGGEFSLEGFKGLVSHRSSDGGRHGLASIWARREWYWDLYTPVGLAGGALWLLALVPRALRRRLDGVDALAGVWLLAGGVWVVIFPQAAYIHEYWGFYLGPFFLLATGWSARAVAGALGGLAGRLHRGAGAPVRGAALVAALAAYMAFGAVGAWERQRMPSDVRAQAPEFRFRDAVFARWVHDKLEPGDRLVLQRGIPLRQQMGFYLDSPVDRVKLDAKFRRPRPWKRQRFLVVDRHRLPRSERTRILGLLAERYPVTYFDRFCLYDLKAKDNRQQNVEAYRIVLEPNTFLHAWLESLVYPPLTVEASAYDAFSAALDAGLDGAAKRLAASLAAPPRAPAATPDRELGRTQDWLAWHNAQILLRQPERAAAAREALEEQLGAPLDQKFGDELTLKWFDFRSYLGDRVAALLVFHPGADLGKVKAKLWRRVDDGGLGLTRARRFLHKEHDLYRVFDQTPDAWRAGMLYPAVVMVPREEFPQALKLKLSRKTNAVVRRLRADMARKHEYRLGQVVLERSRRQGASSETDWLEALSPDCQPGRDRGGYVVPERCLGELREHLDLATNVEFVGEDRFRIVGVRDLGVRKNRAAVQVVFQVERPVLRDYRLRATYGPPVGRVPGPKAFDKPRGTPKTSQWRGGQLRFATFETSRKRGVRDVWFHASREAWPPGRQLKAKGSRERGAFVIRVPLTPEERP